ncbi:MAG: prepilin-type N-terminal cleavage/methylation domain-containing protein [Chitinispirillaceae bacterium]|jgi:prepilin-type N-terminal cleavage/methylation domain-containing protein
MRTSNCQNENGFTLVEGIVVAVIVAVLSAVATPLYMGYVRDTRINVADNIASMVASACGATKLEDSSLVAAVINGSPYASTRTTVSTITLKGMGGEDNKIQVPADFSVSVDNTNVVCIYTKDANIVSRTFTF